jgi:type IV pilus assembly protein PilB
MAEPIEDEPELVHEEPGEDEYEPGDDELVIAVEPMGDATEPSRAEAESAEAEPAAAELSVELYGEAAWTPAFEESGASGAETAAPTPAAFDDLPGPTTDEGDMTDEPDAGDDETAEAVDAEPVASEPLASEDWSEPAERVGDEPATPVDDVLDFWGGSEREPTEVDVPDLDAGADIEDLGAEADDDALSVDLVPYSEHRRPQLGTLLVRTGLLTAEQLAAALEEKEETGERLGDIVLRHGWISEHDLAHTLAEQHRLEFIDIASMAPNPAVGTLLPQKYARRYEAVPTRYLDDETLLVAVADPTNVLANDELRLVLGPRISLAVAPRSDVRALIERLYPDTGEPDDAVVTTAPAEADEDGRAADGPFEVLEQVGNSPAVEFVNEVIRRGIQEGASDLHFEPQAARLLVRARIDGVMRDLRIGPARLAQAVTARLKIMGELDIAERRVPQDGRVTIRFGGQPVDLRVAVMPTTHGEQIVLRILYRTATPLGFEELGLAPDTIQVLTHAIAQPYGAVISVGPTGSGKTTTLYAALGMLNTKERCVMTIEDPVEYQLEGVNQIQVNTKAGLTFAQGLRTILRSDPDVLLVGEVRDSETAKIAVQAAMTGHLVLSTLHADNVGSAVSRLTDMGVERELLATTINCLFAQRLARKLCPSCREAYEVDVEELLAAGAREADLPVGGNLTLFRARGCNQCVGGYKGRIGLFETLLVSPKMRRLIESATAEEIYEAAVSGGMRTLQQDGLRLSIAGHTSLEEARRVAGVPRI